VSEKEIKLDHALFSDVLHGDHRFARVNAIRFGDAARIAVGLGDGAGGSVIPVDIQTENAGFVTDYMVEALPHILAHAYRLFQHGSKDNA